MGSGKFGAFASAAWKGFSGLLPGRRLGRNLARAANDQDDTPALAADGEINISKAVRPHIGLAIAFSAVLNLLMLGPSIYMLQVYDRVLVSGGLLTLAFLSIVVVVCLIVVASLDGLRAKIMARAGLKFDRDLSARVMRCDLESRGAKAGEATSGIRNLDSLRQGLSGPAFTGLMDVPWTPLFVLVCFIVHPYVGWLTTAGVVVIFGLALLNERAMRHSITQISAIAPRFYGGLEADMRAGETARALGMQDALVQRRQDDRRDLLNEQVRAAFVGADFTAITKFVRLFLQSAALGLGAYLAVNQEITAGAIIAVTIMSARAIAPVEQVVGGWRQLAQTWESYKALQTLLRQDRGVGQRMTLPPPRGKVELVNIAATARGSETVVLSGISIAVEPGEVIGVIGPSGSGKSTLARVLANAAAPVMGEIRMDGARYRDWPQSALAAYIGYVPQSVDLMAGTVAENISRFAIPDAETGADIEAKIIQAAKDSGAYNMILQLPQAFETRIGGGGLGLSAGQAQRIALARALYGRPPLIVLDEPNASVDSEGEAALMESLSAAKERGATIFLIAHRMGVMSIANRLMVLREGRMVELGARDAIIQKLSGGNVKSLQQTRNEGASA